MDNKLVEAVANDLASASRHLAEAASSLAQTAVPVSVPAADPTASPPGTKAAVPAGAPVRLPEAGLPVARVLSSGADPVARAAPLVASAALTFAPAALPL
jgi:hypothetical protein